jgi:hypothetical protein
MLEELDVAFFSVALGVRRKTLNGEIIDMIEASRCLLRTLILRRVTTEDRAQYVHNFIFFLAAHCASLTSLQFVDCDWHGDLHVLNYSEKTVKPLFPNLKHFRFDGQVPIKTIFDTGVITSMLSTYSSSRSGNSDGLRSFDLRLKMWPHHIPGEELLSYLGEGREAGMDIHFAYGLFSDPDPEYDFGGPMGEDSDTSDTDWKESGEEEEEEGESEYWSTNSPYLSASDATPPDGETSAGGDLDESAAP